MQTSDSITTIAKALAAAQQAMGSAQRDSKNGHFRSRYASLASCLHACLGPLNTHGVSLLQHPSYDPEAQLVSVETVLMHSSGEYIASTCSLPLGGKRDGHALKSATTYLRRTAIVSVLGLPEEDDDGNATSAVGSYKAQAAPPAPKVTAEDLVGYAGQLEGLDLKPATVAAFFKAHGKAPARSATGEQLFQRLEWVKANAATITQWAEDQAANRD